MVLYHLHWTPNRNFRLDNIIMLILTALGDSLIIRWMFLKDHTADKGSSTFNEARTFPTHSKRENRLSFIILKRLYHEFECRKSRCHNYSHSNWWAFISNCVELPLSLQYSLHNPPPSWPKSKMLHVGQYGSLYDGVDLVFVFSMFLGATVVTAFVIKESVRPFPAPSPSSDKLASSPFHPFTWRDRTSNLGTIQS